MARVHIPTMFQPLCGGARSLELEAATLRDLLRQPDTRCRLQLERNGHCYEVTLELRRLV